MRIGQWLGLVTIHLSAAVAYGAETTLSLEHPFEGTGSFVDLAEQTTGVIALLILAIVLVTLVFGRQRIAPPQVQFLRFVGLCALPIFMLVVGTFANFEGSKRVTFCQSCHTAMDLYVDDMKDPEKAGKMAESGFCRLLRPRPLLLPNRPVDPCPIRAEW